MSCRNQGSQKRIFRLFNCSFHHFNDAMAIDILKSTMDTSEGFAIIELQDRRLGMLFMMLCNWVFVLPLVPPTCKLKTPFWSHTYGVPNILIYPFLWSVVLVVLQVDGFVSCLRTREFNEFVQLVQQAAKIEGRANIRTDFQDGECLEIFDLPSWEIRSHQKVLHTLPFGYVRMITGVRRVPT